MALTYNPASGSSFPVGTTSVLVTAQSSDGQTASCGFSATVTYSPAPAPSVVGPQSTITCPAGAVDIFPGIDIQGIVNLYTGNTTFCLRAGIHSRTERDHAEDRQYVRRRVRRDPGRHRMGNDGFTRRARSGRTTRTSTT